MKRIVLLLLATCFASLAFAQSTEGDPANKLKPDLPAFKLLSLDSTKVQTKEQLAKGKPVMILLFSPDCDHCKQLTESIVANKKKLKDIQVVMSSFKSLPLIKPFYEATKASEIPNLIIGKDFSWFFSSYYKFQKYPLIALYNKNHQLINTYEYTVDIKQLLDILNK
ncbi:hypothetical protein CAP36_13310 [Chitinophagaceae bacterium IBVUCB2]|nr:hypothetical protein CAP36_13310 [Chitinophagaceae bacterium IBVUCB2]